MDRLPRDEIEKKAKLQAENPRYVEDSASGLSQMDKNRIIQRAEIISRQNEAANRITARSGGKKRSTRNRRKTRKGKYARHEKENTQRKRERQRERLSQNVKDRRKRVKLCEDVVNQYHLPN